MNIARINEIRTGLGLAPLSVGNPHKAAKAKRTERNRRERGAENRALKAARQGRSK